MKKLKVFYSIGIVFLVSLVLTSCSKEETPPKPKPSAFTVDVQGALPIYPTAGMDVNVTINAGTNGWWIDVPDEGKQWLKPAKFFGSANQTIVIKISPNTTGVSRKVEMAVNPTFNLEPVKITFEQSGN
jgi:hypothetical protein